MLLAISILVTGIVSILITKYSTYQHLPIRTDAFFVCSIITGLLCSITTGHLLRRPASFILPPKPIKFLVVATSISLLIKIILASISLGTYQNCFPCDVCDFSNSYVPEGSSNRCNGRCLCRFKQAFPYLGEFDSCPCYFSAYQNGVWGTIPTTDDCSQLNNLLVETMSPNPKSYGCFYYTAMTPEVITILVETAILLPSILVSESDFRKVLWKSISKVFRKR